LVLDVADPDDALALAQAAVMVDSSAGGTGWSS